MEAKKYKTGRVWGVCFYDESGKYLSTQSYSTRILAEKACDRPETYYKKK